MSEPSLHLDFEYTLEDMRDLHRIARKNPRKVLHGNSPSNRFGRGILGWLVFIGLSLMLVFLLNTKNHVGRRAPSPATSWATLALEFFQWFFFAFFVVLIFILVRFPSDSILKRRQGFQKVISMDIDNAGIRSNDGPATTIWRWDAFDLFIENDKRFFVRLFSSMNYVVIPKRALSEPTALEQVRDLLQTNVKTATGAFPVISSESHSS